MRILVTGDGRYYAMNVMSQIATEKARESMLNEYIKAYPTGTFYGQRENVMVLGTHDTAEAAAEEARRAEAAADAIVREHNRAVQIRKRNAALASYEGELYGKDEAGKFFKLT